MKQKRRALLERAAQRGKYAPLYRHLKKLRSKEWRATFEEIEEILGFSLPDSARIHSPWWANQGVRGGHSHALSWEMAGWKSLQINMVEEKLAFVRNTQRNGAEK